MKLHNESGVARLLPLSTIFMMAVSCISATASAAGDGPKMPVPGDIAISEVMINPAAPVDDNYGEYFEVTNISSKVLDLSNLYFQDQQAAGSASAPHVRIPAGALPPLYPGKSFVFARSADPALNGAIPKVDYAYAVPVGSPVPADKSKVSSTGMAFSNSTVDMLAITMDAPFNMGGFVIEMVTFDPTKAPMNVNNGIGFERGNLMNGWVTGNISASTGTFGTPAQSGTPGSFNSNDTTLHPSYYVYTPVNPTPFDTGVLKAQGAASVHGGTATLLLSKGAPFQLFAMAVSPESAAYEFVGGTVLVDFLQAEFWAIDSYLFDANGNATLIVGVPAALLGSSVHLQWYCYNPGSGEFIFSNGLSVDVAP